MAVSAAILPRAASLALANATLRGAGRGELRCATDASSSEGDASVPFGSIQGLQMYYEEHGRPEGSPLVLLHGFSGTGRVWGDHLAALGATYRLLVPDLRGHGRTDNPGGLAAMNHRQFGRDIIALCGELALERPIFVGHSTGAMLQLTIGVEAPELPMALVLSAGTYFYGEELRAWWRSRTPETHVPPERRQAMQAVHTALGPDQWRRLAEAFLALHQHAPQEDFPVAVPVALYGLIPESELCILPNAGHAYVHSHAEWWRNIVQDFLNRRTGT
jgi:pimeloyl-ACP methyl ester carboxylesterase